MTLTLQGARFGAIDYLSEDIIQFTDGLIGFPQLRHFLLIAHSESSPFRWLQSIDEPALAFLTIDPNHYISDFSIQVTDEVANELDLSESTPTLALTTVSIPPGKPNDLTLNLSGPLIINVERRVGKQVVVEGESEKLRRRVFTNAAA